jgi:Tripartite tricarboxylate transporter TctB family
MMKKISPTGYFLIFLIFGMAVFFVTSLNYEELQIKLMPLLMSGFTIVLSLIALVQDVRSGSRDSMPTDEEGDVIEDERKLTPLSAYFKALGWFLALIAAVYFLGILVATPLWMAAYLSKTETQWWKAALIGVGLTVIIYMVFTVVLKVELYQGLAGVWLLNQLGL